MLDNPSDGFILRHADLSPRDAGPNACVLSSVEVLVFTCYLLTFDSRVLGESLNTI